VLIETRPLNTPSAVSDTAARQPFAVHLLDNAAEPSWDAFVAQADHSSIVHLVRWREILSDVLGAECLYWVATDPSGTCQGVLPVARVKSRLFGHYLVSLPFLNYGGPLGSPAARRRLVDEAVAEARRSNADLLELRTRYAEDLALPVAARKLTVLRELPASRDELWNALPSKLRSQVRRPLKAGLATRFGADQQAPFYEVFTRTMRDLGTPVLPRAWFERIGSAFAELVVFGAVYASGSDEPLAAGCGFVWGGEFEITWAASRRDQAPVAANMLLYWSFMEEMIRRGVRVFNFGRCTPGGGTHRFKQQWGGSDVPLPWTAYAPRGRLATPSPNDSTYAWGPRLWRWLPLPIANRLGPQLVRLLP